MRQGFIDRSRAWAYSLGHWLTDARRRTRRRGLILLYHRVTELDGDRWQLAVCPQFFRTQLEVLRNEYTVVSVRELLDPQGTLPERPVAITFDDGYADNVTVVEPILDALQLPATLFVTTGNITSQREYWWDELERITESPRFPQAGNVSEGQASVVWGQPEEQAPTGVTVQRDGNADPYRELWQQLYFAGVDERDIALEALGALAGDSGRARPSHRPATWTELSQWHKAPHLQVGLHTRSHLALPSFAPTVQENEIDGGRADLCEYLGEPLKLLAYPYGNHDAVTRGVAHDLGLDGALTTASGATHPIHDRYQIPRSIVPNIDGDQFARWLADQQ